MRAVRPASISSIIWTLVRAVAICAVFFAVFLLVGVAEIAVAFLLAVTIGVGLVVVAVAWRAITRGRSDSN